ncbi:MAG: hypothetical protein GX265_04980 [Mollicutes bacterium]|nr:hypothetical protein [Mollicutes bacterium]
MKCLVLSAKKYDFESNGDRIQGVKIAYLNKKTLSRDNEYGTPPLIVNCPIDSILPDVLDSLPAICNLEFEQVTGRNNKPELILTNVDYLESVNLI